MKRKINWWNVGLILMVLAIIIILALTPEMHRLANLHRQQYGINNGIGSEFIVWMFPLTYLAIYLERKHYGNKISNQ